MQTSEINSFQAIGKERNSIVDEVLRELHLDLAPELVDAWWPALREIWCCDLDHILVAGTMLLRKTRMLSRTKLCQVALHGHVFCIQSSKVLTSR